MRLLNAKQMELIPAQYNAPIPMETANEILYSLASSHLDLLTEEGWIAGRVYADCITLRDLPALLDYDPDVLDLSAADQYHLRQVRALFAKRRDVDIGVDRKAAALRKFGEAEQACAVTNACFRAWNQGRFQFHPDVEAVLHGAQRKISQLYGDAPSLDALRPRFGPGANTDVPKRMASIWKKLQKVPSCNEDAIDWIPELLNGFTNYGDEGETVGVSIVPGKLSFVPKTAKIDRVTITEPPLVGVWQLALGDYMARPLERVGLSIRDQSANQRAALYGSISGASATLDMTSASDTNAVELTNHLWSVDWCELFHRLRTSVVSLDGRESKPQEKISSMGNGFTFPLETAQFWALAQAAKDLWAPKSRVRVLVYGDDIIVPTEIALRFMKVLRALGFMPNLEKSFWSGNFRESCGKDYVSGKLVRPYYIKGHDSDTDDGRVNALLVSDLFRIHNFYVERGFLRLASSVRELVPRGIRLYGPSGYGDGHLHSDVWVARSAAPQKGWSGYTFRTWGFEPRVQKSSHVRDLEKGTKLSYKSWSKVEQKVKTRRLTYRAYTLRHVLRVATYAAYIREVCEAGDGSAVMHRPAPQYFRGLSTALDALYPLTASDGDTPFVIPGAGRLRVNKVYTFEPPRLQQ